MLRGIAHYERSHGKWSAFLDDEARAEHEPLWIRSKKWDGVISRHTTPALVRSCAERGIPLVDVNDVPVFPGVPKIRPDNVALGHLAAEHFLERGFVNFAYCGFGNLQWACERHAGFTEALSLAGHTCGIHEVDYPGETTPTWDAKQITILGEWLESLPKPVGILGCMDARAFQIMAAAQQSGLHVPEEVAVLGVNNDSIRCELSHPPLSSVAPNAFQSGYRAAETLETLMKGGKPPEMDVRIEPLGVVTRPSTDVLAIHDRCVASALNFIRERACQAVTVEDVLKHSFASRSQLERKFRKHLGRSPQAEIRRVQVEKIRQLLIETDFPLKKIADLTGFEHVEYLSVVFKRLTGESPGAYRKKQQETAG